MAEYNEYEWLSRYTVSFQLIPSLQVGIMWFSKYCPYSAQWFANNLCNCNFLNYKKY